MTTLPDKLFRQGLEHFQKPAPGSAWERIESGLGRKSNRSLWMKIAAGLFLVIATTALFLQFNQNDTAIAEASKLSITDTLETDSTLAAATELQERGDRRQEAVDNQQSPVGSRDSIIKRESSGVRREALTQNKPSVDNYILEYDNSKKPKSSRLQTTVYSPQSAVSTQKTIPPDGSNVAVINDPVEKMTESKTASQATITNEISITEASSDSKRTNFTYSANEVNEKFLKKESTSEATPEKKNTSGLQKVIDLALDLKNEGSVL